MAVFEKLRKLRTYKQDAFALRCQLRYDTVNILLRAYVDAARRVVQEQHLGVFEQPFREQNLLLISSAQTANVDLIRCRFEAACADEPVPRRAILRAYSKIRTTESGRATPSSCSRARSSASSNLPTYGPRAEDPSRPRAPRAAIPEQFRNRPTESSRMQFDPGQIARLPVRCGPPRRARRFQEPRRAGDRTKYP